jgi:hypothetical protein
VPGKVFCAVSESAEKQHITATDNFEIEVIVCRFCC